MKYKQIRATRNGAVRRTSNTSKNYLILMFNFLLGISNIVQMAETFGLVTSLKHFTDSMV
jgi:hypothetical protein